MTDEAREAAPNADYYRRDQSDGVTAPDLSKDCSVASHIVRARGKRTKYTSVSLDQNKIDDFGPTLYKALCREVVLNGHTIIEHGALMRDLREAALSSDKGDRLTALQAQRYATRRREGLIDWSFDISRVDRKDLITWAFRQVQKFFQAL
jgi:hypothetical protein